MGPMLQKRWGHAAVTLDQHVYVIGGGEDESSPSSTTTEILAAGSTTWQQGPPLPIEMFNGPCAVAISSTSFLVFYGKEIREFDVSIAGPTSSKGWVEEGRWPKLEIDRHLWPGCAKVGKDKVVIAGGFDGYSVLQTTDILDLTSRKLSEGGKMGTTKFLFHIITFNHNGDFTTLALGGDENVGSGLDTDKVERWNPETATWSAVKTRLKEKRSAFGAVAAPKTLICPSK